MTSIDLLYNGDCAFIGITPDYHLYVEEFYEDSTVQHLITLQGKLLKTVDADESPLSVPPDLITPRPAKITTDLNFSGARYRGMREPERIADLVKPLTVAEKMLFKVPVLGLAESVVLSEAEFEGHCVVCRRVRIAYALPEVRYDQDRQPYDYDTLTLYLAHFYAPEIDLVESFKGLPGVKFNRPMDCLGYEGHLLIADGGDGEQKSRVHILKGIE